MNKSLIELLKNKKLGAIVFDMDFNIVQIAEPLSGGHQYAMLEVSV